MKGWNYFISFSFCISHNNSLSDNVITLFLLSFEPPALGIIFKVGDPVLSAKPLQFTQVAHIAKKGVDDAFLWYPIAPPGYASIGCVVSRTEEAPALDSFCCPRIDLVSQANIHETPVLRSLSARGSQCWSLWKVDNQVRVMFYWKHYYS